MRTEMDDRVCYDSGASRKSGHLFERLLIDKNGHPLVAVLDLPELAITYCWPKRLRYSVETRKALTISAC